MTQTADRYGKVLYDLRVPAEDVEQMKAALCAAPQLVNVHFILFSVPYYAKIKSKAPVFTRPQPL